MKTRQTYKPRVLRRYRVTCKDSGSVIVEAFDSSSAVKRVYDAMRGHSNVPSDFLGFFLKYAPTTEIIKDNAGE